MSWQYLSWWHLSISGISQLILTLFWPNFKGRFLVLLTIFNRCQLSRWHLSRQHLSWQHLSISEISQLLLTKFFGSNYLGALIIGPKFFLDLNFVSTKFFLTQKCLRPNIFWGPMFLDPTFFGQFEQRILLDQQIFYRPKFFLEFFSIEQQCYSTKFLVILVNHKNN